MDEETKQLLTRLKELKANAPEPAAIWVAKRELAAELRGWANRICASRADVTQIRELVDLLAEHRGVLREQAGPSAPGPAPLSDIAPGMEDFLDRGPIAGKSNPIAPPANFELDVDALRVVGDVTFGRAYEGGPGIVHGGFPAAVLDEALGMSCVFAGGPMMTAELTTRYHHHTPIDVPLRVEARVDSSDGKKVWSSGEITRDGEKIVSSTGLFIRVGSVKFADLFAAKHEEGAG